MPKRTKEELTDVGPGGPGEEEQVKRQQLPSSDYGAELPAEQLEQMAAVAFDIVNELYQDLVTGESTLPDGFSEAFSGVSQDFIQKELASGAPVALEAPDPMDAARAQYSEDDDEAVEDDELENPEEYAWQLAEELCDEILTEIVEEYLSGMQRDDALADVLSMSEVVELRAEIAKVVYDTVWEEWGYERA